MSENPDEIVAENEDGAIEPFVEEDEDSDDDA